MMGTRIPRILLYLNFWSQGPAKIEWRRHDASWSCQRCCLFPASLSLALWVPFLTMVMFQHLRCAGSPSILKRCFKSATPKTHVGWWLCTLVICCNCNIYTLWLNLNHELQERLEDENPEQSATNSLRMTGFWALLVVCLFQVSQKRGSWFVRPAVGERRIDQWTPQMPARTPEGANYWLLICPQKNVKWMDHIEMSNGFEDNSFSWWKNVQFFFCIFGDVCGDNIRDPVANVGLIGSFFCRRFKARRGARFRVPANPVHR